MWEVKTARIHLVVAERGRPSRPSERMYWLILARQPKTGEIKYFISNAAESVELVKMLQAAFARWTWRSGSSVPGRRPGWALRGAHLHQSHPALVLLSLAMYFLAAQTQRLRGESTRITLEQVAEAPTRWRPRCTSGTGIRTLN